MRAPSAAVSTSSKKRAGIHGSIALGKSDPGFMREKFLGIGFKNAAAGMDTEQKKGSVKSC